MRARTISSVSSGSSNAQLENKFHAQHVAKTDKPATRAFGVTELVSELGGADLFDISPLTNG